jgi:regulatory protein
MMENMIVTGIESVMGPHSKKPRFRVFIDEKFAFVLYKGELSRYGITLDQEIDMKTYEEINESLLPKRARNRALYLLKDRRYTEMQIREKLEKNGYTPAIIDTVVDYLKLNAYIDDKQYTHDYIDYHHGTKSRQMIYQELNRKGIPQEVTDVIYQQICSDEDCDELEQQQIKRWLEKKMYDKDNCDTKERQRIFAFLARKGYQYDIIKKHLF